MRLQWSWYWVATVGIGKCPTDPPPLYGLEAFRFQTVCVKHKFDANSFTPLYGLEALRFQTVCVNRKFDADSFTPLYGLEALRFQTCSLFYSFSINFTVSIMKNIAYSTHPSPKVALGLRIVVFGSNTLNFFYNKTYWLFAIRFSRRHHCLVIFWIYANKKTFRIKKTVFEFLTSDDAICYYPLILNIVHQNSKTISPNSTFKSTKNNLNVNFIISNILVINRDYQNRL